MGRKDGLPDMVWSLVEGTDTDLESILAIERRSFPDPWTEEMFYAELDHPFSRIWVAKQEEGGAVGFACFWLIIDEIHFLDLAVDPAFRRKGIGEMLIREVLVWGISHGASVAYLEVRESNRAARNLYQKMGFEIVGRRDGYYEKPREDALVMKFSTTGRVESPADRGGQDG